MRSSTLFRRALTIALLAAAATATALPASAHAELIATDPADGATVTELSSVHFEFSEDLLDIGNAVIVTDGDGVAHDATLTFPKPNQMDAAVTDVAPGDVTIAWRNASVDGHTEEGQLHVTLVATGTTASATPTPQVTSADAQPTPTSPGTTTATSGANPDTTSGGTSVLLWVGIAIAVLAGAGIAIYAATRKPNTPPKS